MNLNSFLVEWCKINKKKIDYEEKKRKIKPNHNFFL